VERHVLSWLGCQGLAVPFNQTFDLTTDALAPVCMQFVGDTPPPSERARQAARALAAIHATTRGRHAELPWLPRADASFVAQWIIETCWREPWQRVLAGKEYVDAYGNHWGPAKPGGDFRAEFGAYTQPLEAAAGRFVQAMAELWDEGDSLTLIHADFHSAHVRTYDSRDYVIDWGFAHYGSFYVDLPNYFSREEALVYRDELAKLGHDIPRDTFLARYDAISPYPGFKYFGLGLWNWCYGDPPHQREHVVHFVDMVLKSPK
ncbi:MAG TPA: phosphotransferase, partial [Herpetosiphonaceae bacterium]|nr:phosphotransferase [Herpetosiphonaceae bacterium]